MSEGKGFEHMKKRVEMSPVEEEEMDDVDAAQMAEEEEEEVEEEPEEEEPVEFWPECERKNNPMERFGLYERTTIREAYRRAGKRSWE